MLVKCYSASILGIDAVPITIEVNVSQGIKFFLVGLPDNAVKESHERIISAYQQCERKMPRKQVVINMAPADLRKEGASFDLALAIGILAASEQIKNDQLADYMMIGELSLDGTLQPVKGILPIAIKAREEGFKGLIVPIQNSREAAVVNNLQVLGANNLKEVIDFFDGTSQIPVVEVDTREIFKNSVSEYESDFSDVKGQEDVKRAMEVAAAGGHNLLMVGAPGSGKSMLAKRLPSILPPLTLHEALETTKIQSVAGKTDQNTTLINTRPFRSPHHTISDVALVGGGTYPQPGEISLAHNGVLFLDELPEFKRAVLEVLRQPLEDRHITISRARFSVDYPSSFMLISSMNPCPCGFHNHPEKTCVCAPGMVQKYLSKISGPLLDRIDIQIEVVPVSFDKIADLRPAETSLKVRERVIKAREIQSHRFENMEGTYCNAQMSTRMLRKYAALDETCRTLLKNAMEKFDLSARAYDRILKVSRTIADLDASDHIQPDHISEAIQYRNLDRDSWGN